MFAKNVSKFLGTQERNKIVKILSFVGMSIASSFYFNWFMMYTTNFVVSFDIIQVHLVTFSYFLAFVYFNVMLLVHTIFTWYEHEFIF